MLNLAPLCRLVYRAAPEPVRRRLRSRRPPGVSEFTVPLPDGKQIILWGLEEANFVKELFWRGFEGANPEFTRVFHALAKRASAVIDLGSYLGYYSLIAARANPEAAVYSVEPLPDSIAYQKSLVQLNHLKNLQLCPVGVSETTGRMPFFTPSRSLSRIPNIGSLINRFGPGTYYTDREGVSVEIDVVTLTDLMTRFEIERVDLVKFFVEEVETDVFTAGRDVLERWKPDLIGWVFYRGDNVDRLGDLLATFGYSVFVFRGQSLVRCPTLADAAQLGDVFNPDRGGRSAVFITVDPEARMLELSKIVPGVRAD